MNDGGRDTPLRLEVNGRGVELAAEPGLALLDLLRGRLGLKGARRSCDSQVCGACTVLLDGQPVSSCNVLAFQARDRKVTTIEGLARSPGGRTLIRAFAEHAGVQCGFCTPGMVVTASSLLQEVPEPTEEQVKEYMRGNLCRCTGYKKIVEAVLAAATGEV